MKKALILIDIQNDYFKGGNYPLWNSEKVLENSLDLIDKLAREKCEIIYVRHIGDKKSLFFRPNTWGIKIHKKLLEVDYSYEVIEKKYADSFYETNLDRVLQNKGVEEIFLCGMMSHNCVTFTALSKSAEKYKVKVIKNCSTSKDKVINSIAFRALETRVEVI